MLAELHSHGIFFRIYEEFKKKKPTSLLQISPVTNRHRSLDSSSPAICIKLWFAFCSLYEEAVDSLYLFLLARPNFNSFLYLKPPVLKG